jgi:Holliday junction resolvase RusA-like endonuclease
VKKQQEIKRYVFKITPQTHVRATQGDRILFRIPEERRSPASTKRVKRLIKYNEYKVSVLAEAKRLKFNMPDEGCGIRFFFPMPKTWRKPKREALKNKLHKQRPDLDNTVKAIFDSLFIEDKSIAHISEASKYWVDSEQGWIEFIVRPYTPCVIESPYTTTESIK